ncbi:MAG: ABC transporter permease [Acidimicrobiales bacterium]
MKALTIAAVNLRRFLRDRSNVFWVFLFPMLLILVLGASFGGTSEPRLGVYGGGDGGFADDLITLLNDKPQLDVIEAGSPDDLEVAVERGELEAGLIIPADYDVVLRSGSSITIELVTSGVEGGQGVIGQVQAALTEQSVLLRTASFVEAGGIADFDLALETADAVAAATSPVGVSLSTVGDPIGFFDLGRFDASAQQQLLLFVFLTSLTASAALIQTRRLGVSRRMVATPTSVGTILIGESLGRLAVALLQGVFIMLGTLVLFGVDWGQPLGAVVIIVAFSLVGSGAAMLMGSLFSNDQQASGVAVMLGLGLAALGGCMIPLVVFEVFAPGLWRVAHITPHAWALEAFDALIIDDGTVVDTLPFVAILLGYAIVFYALATWRLRAVLTR